MVKLSELEDDAKIIDENGTIYDVADIKWDLKHFENVFEEKIYTTTEYQASIDARDMLESAIESEYENSMYEDWNEHILSDITDEDIEKIQAVLDDILSRARGQNTSYFQGEEIEVDIDFERVVPE